jgi:hypothetical protein
LLICADASGNIQKFFGSFLQKRTSFAYLFIYLNIRNIIPLKARPGRKRGAILGGGRLHAGKAG